LPLGGQPTQTLVDVEAALEPLEDGADVPERVEGAAHRLAHLAARLVHAAHGVGDDGLQALRLLRGQIGDGSEVAGQPRHVVESGPDIHLDALLDLADAPRQAQPSEGQPDQERTLEEGGERDHT
jgi:hypothetical protein